jgi:hypothetical protein
MILTGSHWKPLDFSHILSEECPPTLLFGGWFDYQRRYLWEDYCRLRRAGVPHRLVMGPWMHGGGWAEGNVEALRWFDTHVKERSDAHKVSASFYVTGSDQWKEVAGCPDAESKSERCPDVVCFTSDAFEEPLTFFGPVTATLWVKSSAASADFFVRVTDVYPDGASRNVIDALRRVEHDARLHTSEEPLKLEIDLGPCAHHFDAGHRLRVQISSGAFPFYARNLGTGEDLATGTQITKAEQTLYHDSQYPAHVTALLASTQA